MHSLAPVFIGAIIVLVVAGGCNAPQPRPHANVLPQASRDAEGTQDVATVRQALTDAVKAFPADPNAILELALFDLKTASANQAEREMTACWKRFPHYARAPYHLGLHYLRQGRNEDAIRYLLAAAADEPGDVDVQWNAGRACIRVGDQKAAIVFLKKAIKIDPQVAEPYLLLAECYDHPGTASLGIASLHQFLKRTANPAPGYYLLGRLYSRQADRAHAEEWLQRAVQADPDNSEYWVALGRVYFELSNATQAQVGMDCYARALKLDPNNWAAHQYLGHALLDRQQYEAAIPHLRAALQNATERGPRYYDLSQALLKAGHEEEGRKALAAYQDYRQFQDGVTRLNHAIVAAPHDRSRHYALVRYCLEHHQPGAAQSVLNETVRQLGTDATAERLQYEVTSLGAPTSSPSSPLTQIPNSIP